MANEITPALFLRKGRKLIQIQPEQCGLLMRAFVGDRGASEMRKPWIDLHDADGAIIGRISYNGRVWIGTGDDKREITVGETAAEMQARWKSEAAQRELFAA